MLDRRRLVRRWDPAPMLNLMLEKFWWRVRLYGLAQSLEWKGTSCDYLMSASRI